MSALKPTVKENLEITVENCYFAIEIPIECSAFYHLFDFFCFVNWYYSKFCSISIWEKSEQQKPIRKINKQCDHLCCGAWNVIAYTFHTIQWKEKKKQNLFGSNSLQKSASDNRKQRLQRSMEPILISECFNRRRFDKRIHFHFDTHGYCIGWCAWYRGVSHVHGSFGCDVCIR